MITKDDLTWKPDADASLLLGIPAKDVSRYSLRRVLEGVLRGNPPTDGLEGECHQEMKMRRSRPAQVEGFGVPYDVFTAPAGPFREPRMTRAPGDMQVGVWGQGGALVPTDVAPEVIPLLRNKICAVRLGATVLTGLTGFFALPRQIAPATPQSLPETGAVNPSNPQLDQPLIVPHRVSVDVAYSKQLLLQSAVAIENWLREDLFTQMAILFDSLLLTGSGANDQPTGVMNTVGVSSTLFNGAATWASILEFENLLAGANADVPGARIAWITTPNVRNKLKATAQALIGATTVSAKSIWETGQWPDTSNDGLMNGYRAAVTNQIPNDRVLFGNWTDLIFALFGNGLDLLYNPYIRAKEAIVEITVTAYCDVAVRHQQSFIVSGDAGSQ